MSKNDELQKQELDHQNIVGELNNKLEEQVEMLKIAEEQLRQISDYILDMVAIADSRNKIIYASPSCKKFLGYMPEEIVGKSIFELIHPDDVNNIKGEIKKAIEKKEPGKVEYRYRHKDGRYIWLETVGNFLFDKSGNISGAIFSSRDIAERKKAEEALKQSEEKFRKPAETAPATIFIHKGGKFCYVNSFIELMTGYKREELLGMDFWEIVHPDFRELIKSRGIARLSGEKIPPRYEFKIITKNGEERWVDFTGDIISYEGEPAVIGTAYDITERKRAEEALKVSEETYKFLFEESPSINIIIGTDGKIKNINKVAENTGYSREELIGKNVLDLIVPSHKEKVLKSLEEAFKGEDTPDIDVDIIAKDGSVRTLIISRGQAQLYKDGKLDGILIAGMDITNTKLVEESAVRAKQEWEKTFDAVPDAIMLLDDEFTVLRLNRAVADKLKTPIKELIGKKCYDVFCGANGPAPNCPHAKAIAEKREIVEEMFIEKFGGHYLVSVSPVLDANGNFTYAVHVARDITERKTAEEAIKSKSELENTLLRISSRFVGVVDLDWAINESLADIGQLAGADRAYVFTYRDDGKTMSNTHEWCREGVSPHIQRLQDIPLERFAWWNEKILKGEVISLEDISTLPKEASAEQEEFEKQGIKSVLGIPLYVGGNIAGFVGFDNVKRGGRWSDEQLILLKFLADIFGGALGRVRSEKEKDELEKELLQSQKMEALGRLAGGIAHDFNNLLTGIIGYSQMLLTSINPLDPMKKDIEEIKKAAERGASLTKRLLTFSRKQPVTPKVINVNEIISNYKSILARIIGEDIDLVFVPTKNLGNIKIDQSQFEQVLLNLVINSRDAMPRGGKLIIETKNTTINEEFCLHHSNVTVGEYVVLIVSDNGVGMDEETKKHIFEPFFTTKEYGTGLGLPIVYGIVKQNGGFIDVTSKVGVGTTFKIYFPRVYEKTERHKPSKQTKVIGKETILLVEDENMLRDLIKKVLQVHGYKVLDAKSSKQALQLFEKHKSKIKLLITDVIIPGMSGIELFEKLREKKPKLKVLLTSGHPEEVVGQPSAREKSLPFLQKPFTIDELLKKVMEVIES